MNETRTSLTFDEVKIGTCFYYCGRCCRKINDHMFRYIGGQNVHRLSLYAIVSVDQQNPTEYDPRTPEQKILSAWGVSDEEKIRAMKVIHCKGIKAETVWIEIKKIRNAKGQLKAWMDD